MQSIATSLLVRFCSLLLCSLLLSCTAIRPVSKIGLLAPFEGLHRRSGYEALTVMRQAIADYAPAAVAMMPLALDDGADPTQAERAVRKLLQDRSVRAVIGPSTPLLAQQLEPILVATDLPWITPFAVAPTTGFVPPDQAGEWAIPLLVAAAAHAQTQDCQRLVLAGWTPGWPQLAVTQAQATFAVPLLMSDELASIQPGDAIFWLGSPEAGAIYFTALRTRYPDVPFFLGPQAASPIFSERTQITDPVYLLFWLDDGYEQWRARYGSQSPTAYVTYRATQQAIAMSLGQAWPPSHAWRVEMVSVAMDGAW